MFFYTFLPKLLNMSLTATVAIIFVIVLRMFLRKAPKFISYALWVIVLFRLLCPVSVKSDISLFGLFNTPTVENHTLTSRIEYIPNNIVHTEYPAITLPIPSISNAINHVLPQGQEQLTADPLEAPMAIATYLWMVGLLVMVFYAITSYIKLRMQLTTASHLRDNIYLVDEISCPFVMGLFFPKIYLPSSLPVLEQTYIILHEQHHIHRLDHIFKILGFIALSFHWFNPIVWIAFRLAVKDMEMSCDEAVIRKLGPEILADYTASLLSLATGKHMITGIPLAFGEGDTSERIRHLISFKKPMLWAMLLAITICCAAAICLLTNPAGEEGTLSDHNSSSLNTALEEKTAEISSASSDNTGNSEALITENDLKVILKAEMSEQDRKVYSALVSEILLTKSFPPSNNGSALMDIPYENFYSVIDIDRDGQDELLINNINASYTAAMVCYIYDYDRSTEEIYIEGTCYPKMTFYDNGYLKADASHNHGRSNTPDFWPYNLMKYNREKDRYENIALIDMWQRDLYLNTKLYEDFPQEADLDGDGIIFYDMRDYYRPRMIMDNNVYDEWCKQYTTSAEIAITWHPIISYQEYQKFLDYFHKDAKG